MKQPIYWAACMLLSGCVFGGSKEEAPDRSDTANAPDGDVTADMRTSEDTNRPLPDMSNPVDTGIPDVGPPDVGPDSGTPDVGAPDMGRAPFEVVREFPMTLGGATGLDSPAQVTMFNRGFLAGYNDTVGGAAHVAWYTEDSATSLDAKSYPSVSPSFDLAGDAIHGYATIVAPRKQTVVRFEENGAVPGALVDLIDSYMTTSTDVTYDEMSIAMEREYPYIGETRMYNGWHLDVGVFTDSYGSATDRLGYEIHDIEAIGGGSPSPLRRLLVAGRTNNQYGLVDFQWPGSVTWTNEALGCGPAPPSSRPQRIVPVFEHWTLLTGPTLDATQWRAVECMPAGAAREVRIPTPSMAEVTDFDLAEESVPVRQIGVAWIQDAQVWFALMTLDGAAGTVTLTDPWRIPGATGVYVRTAYNPDRGTFAVAVHDVNAARLILLKRSN